MEARLFEENTIPEFTTPEWYSHRDRALHLEEYVHRERMVRAASYVASIWQNHQVRGVVDLGAGDGGMLQLLCEYGLPIQWMRGYDLQKSNVDGARERDVDVELLDVVANPDHVWGECVIMTEFLEHLVDPHGFLRSVPETVRWVVASSPVNETAESHYAFHCWAWDLNGYDALMLQAGFYCSVHTTVGDFQVMAAGRP